jgi:DNA-binding beta-propeller fold protein YncE
MKGQQRTVGGVLLAMALVGCSEAPREEDPQGNSMSNGSQPTSSTDPTTDPNDDDGGEKLDVGSDTDTGPMPPVEVEFSYIWISNSNPGTVSKIDTQTGVEVARYETGPADQAEPSRTSVNLLGDVAVSNRGSEIGGFGGVTKIVAREEDCQDRNNNGTIDTSDGPDNVLPWGEDECVIWNLLIPSDTHDHGPRPTAWEGALNAAGMPDENPRLWVGWYAFDDNQARIHRLDGATGQIQDTVDIPWNGESFGPYGGAVNADGDFWVLGWHVGPLVRIDGETLEVERIELPIPKNTDDILSYGMALDSDGNPWLTNWGSAMKWDIATSQWQTVTTGNDLMRGMMIDRDNRAWLAVDDTGMSNGCGLGLIDTTTNTVLAEAIELPGCATPVGVSIDVEGFVWVVDQTAGSAFKINPDTFATELVVDGLEDPYTYSDMTGFGLNLVVNPPAG